MIAFRALEERPVVGGEKFSAVIGPAPVFRRVTRVTLTLALLSLVAAVRTDAGVQTVWFTAGALLFTTAFASAWFSGGAEELVCQGGVVTYRRAGPMRDRGRVLPARELNRIDLADTRGRFGLIGVTIHRADHALVVGRGLDATEASFLADALRRHLARHDLPQEPRLSVLPPQRARLPGSLVRVRERR